MPSDRQFRPSSGLPLAKLGMQQVVPRAPWEIRKTDLEAEPVRNILEHLRKTGKLILDGGDSDRQRSLLIENEGDDNARYHD